MPEDPPLLPTHPREVERRDSLRAARWVQLPVTSDARVDTALHLPPRTVAWLADHPHARQFVRSVWDKLTELERSGQYPGAIDALRRVLTHHQPTAAGRCRTCRRWRWRRRSFPCTVWHQIRFDLLGLFVGASRHRQPAGQSSSPGPSGSGNAPTTATAATGGRKESPSSPAPPRW